MDLGELSLFSWLTLEAVQVGIGGGATRLPLARLVPPGQLRDLEELLTPYC